MSEQFLNTKYVKALYMGLSATTFNKSEPIDEDHWLNFVKKGNSCNT